MRRFMVLLALAAVLGISAVAQDKWFMAQTVTAMVESITATSELVEGQFEGKYLYPPINILDGQFATAWCEADAGGSGIGESLTIQLAEPVSFDEIQVVNGFVHEGDYYNKNNRVAALTITQVAGEHFQQKKYQLKDKVETWQSIKFDLPQTAQTITLTIEGVFKGFRYDDTCISDFRLLYKGKPIPFRNVDAIRLVQEENSKAMLKTDSKGFSQAFYSLFKGDVLYLLGPDGSEGYVMQKSPLSMEAAIFDKPKPEKELVSWLDAIGVSEREQFKDYRAANYDWLAGILIDYYSQAPSFELGHFRIVKSQTVDYIDTTTAILLKLDGTKGIYLNGAYYKVIDPSRTLLYYREP